MQLDFYDQDTDEEMQPEHGINNTSRGSLNLLKALEDSEHNSNDQLTILPSQTTFKNSDLNESEQSTVVQQSSENTSGETICSSKSEKQAKLTDYFSRK